MAKPKPIATVYQYGNKYAVTSSKLDSCFGVYWYGNPNSKTPTKRGEKFSAQENIFAHCLFDTIEEAVQEFSINNPIKVKDVF